ncbi:MAG: hypothetical protein ISS70_22670 [Phycisphaerae bacterium]|nr:hypothetical protein [Phycisphaerae bacterium]
MPVSRKAGRIKLAFAVAGAIGVVSVIAYVCRLKSVPTAQRLPPPAQTDGQSSDQIDAEEPAIGEEVSLGRILGTNNPAVPPFGMPSGRPPGEADTPDLSTPAVAVYTVLSLLDQDATERLAGCFVEETAGTASDLYPRYLGHPVELVEVIEEGESAGVIWHATVHTQFSMDGGSRSQGETITLTTRLLLVDGLWKILKLHDGVNNGPKQHDTQAN